MKGTDLKYNNFIISLLELIGTLKELKLTHFTDLQLW